MQFSPDGKFVLSGGRDKRLRYWELATCREQFVFDGFDSEPKAAVVLADGAHALATDGEKLLKLDLKTGSSEVIGGKMSSSHSVAAFSPDGQTVAVSDSYKIRLWRTRDGRELGPLDTKDMIWSLLFSPDSKHVLSVGAGKVTFWDPDEINPAGQATLQDNSQNIKAMAISADGKWLTSISASAGKTLQIFEILRAK